MAWSRVAGWGDAVDQPEYSGCAVGHAPEGGLGVQACAKCLGSGAQCGFSPFDADFDPLAVPLALLAGGAVDDDFNCGVTRLAASVEAMSNTDQAAAESLHQFERARLQWSKRLDHTAIGAVAGGSGSVGGLPFGWAGWGLHRRLSVCVGGVGSGLALDRWLDRLLALVGRCLCEGLVPGRKSRYCIDIQADKLKGKP